MVLSVAVLKKRVVARLVAEVKKGGEGQDVPINFHILIESTGGGALKTQTSCGLSLVHFHQESTSELVRKWKLVPQHLTIK